MQLVNLIEEDFVNYRKPGIFLGFPFCTGKCNPDHGPAICQNEKLMRQPRIDISNGELITRYLSNPITHAVICGGLEPFDSFEELLSFIDAFRSVSIDDIVIYTGYNEDEIRTEIDILKRYQNIIVKFGRFLPNQGRHYDPVLGVDLASDNQYARRIN